MHQRPVRRSSSRLNWPASVVLCVVATGALVLGRGEQQRPTFSARADVSRLEVRVLDSRTRKPVRGLGLSDFTVEVNGKIQDLLAVAEVEADHSKPVSGAEWTIEAGRDAVTNQRAEGRLFVILLDDAMTPGDPYMGKMTRDVANRAVSEMQPGDLAAVVFAQDNRHAQDFTNDKLLLRQAIERFRSRPLECRMRESMAMGALRRTASFLADQPGQKSIIFVSTGPTGCPPFRLPEGNLAAGPHALLSRVLDELRSSPVPIFSVSPAGLKGVGRLGPFVEQAWRGTAALEAVARLSGGRMVANDNAPAAQVPALFHELSSYYAIAYEPSFPLDGALRRVRIKVAKPDVEVVPGDLVLETPNYKAPVRPVASGLVDALAGGLPDGDLPLGLTAVSFTATGQRTGRASLVTTVALLPGALKAEVENTVEVALQLFDAEGRVLLASTERALKITPRADVDVYEISMLVDVPRGRHNVRVAAKRAADGVAGSVYATVDVPDFSRDGLSLSGVAIGRAEGAAPAGREALTGLLPFAPTALRAFATTDHVGALLRIYRAPGRTKGPAVLTTEIIRDSGQVVHSATRTLAPDTTDVEHRVELPLSSLAQGHYLLRFVATADKTRVQRDVRFSVTR